MARDPGLHIKYSDLKKVLRKLLPSEVDINEFAYSLMKSGRPYTITNRGIIVTSDRVEKKAQKILTSSSKDADLMARMIYAARIRKKHKGIQQIKPTTRDWNQVKQLANLANQFCIDFGMTKKQGYLKYIELASDKMKTFNLSRISSMHESITRTHEAIEEIKMDPTPALTQNIHDYYRVKVAKKTGIINRFNDVPDKYVFFVRVAALVTELTVKYEYFIDAQFEAVEYRNSMPEPAQLIGQKAKERINKYLYERGIKI